MKPILIVGAPAVGKSTITNELAKELKIYRLMGSDMIREVIRNVISEDQSPSLHASAIVICDDAPEGEDNMIWGFQKQAEDVRPGINAILKRTKKEGKNLILEGIHPLPGFFNDYELIHIVLTLGDEERHIEQMHGQGVDRSTYKIANIKKARAFQNYLIDEADKHNAHVVENTTIEETVNNIKNIINETNNI